MSICLCCCVSRCWIASITKTGLIDEKDSLLKHGDLKLVIGASLSEPHTSKSNDIIHSMYAPPQPKSQLSTCLVYCSLVTSRKFLAGHETKFTVTVRDDSQCRVVHIT